MFTPRSRNHFTLTTLVAGSILAAFMGVGCRTSSSTPEVTPAESSVESIVSDPDGVWTVRLSGYVLARGPLRDPTSGHVVFDMHPATETDGFPIEVVVYPATSSSSLDTAYLPLAQQAQSEGCTTCVPMWDSIAGASTLIFDTGAGEYRYYVSIRSGWILEVKAVEGHFDAAHVLMETFRASSK